jgi:glutathione synthase/RimK-type ligase-like ATP-grasp enzyme
MKGAKLQPDDVAAVIYRRPKDLVPPIDADAYQRQHAAGEWAGAIEGFLAHIPIAKWINHPSLNFSASHKVHQLTRAAQYGLHVPPWLVTTLPNEATQFQAEHGTEVIAKPLAAGYIERPWPDVSTSIYTQPIDRCHSTLFERLPACPVLFQRRIQKSLDVRVVFVDNSHVAVAMEGADANGRQRLDIRRSNMKGVQYFTITIPHPVEVGVRSLLTEYGLRFAALDFAIDRDGNWIFLEINPNGQWAWLDFTDQCDIGAMFVKSLQNLPGIR